MLLPRGLGYDNVCEEELGWFLVILVISIAMMDLYKIKGCEKEFTSSALSFLFLH